MRRAAVRLRGAVAGALSSGAGAAVAPTTAPLHWAAPALEAVQCGYWGAVAPVLASEGAQWRDTGHCAMKGGIAPSD